MFSLLSSLHKAALILVTISGSFSENWEAIGYGHTTVSGAPEEQRNLLKLCSFAR